MERAVSGQLSRERLQAPAVRLLLAGTMVCLLCGAGWADRDKSWAFDIPRQNVGTALSALAQQTGTQLLFPYDAVTSQEANPLTGRYTLDEALEIMLRGTGLTGGITGSGVIAISLETSATSQDQGDDMEREKKKGILAGLTSVVLSIFSVQNATGQDTAEGLSTGGTPVLEEIIVTAQKREERLIDVPLSMSVLSADELARLGATRFRDFANTVPGLSFTEFGAGMTQVTLRGVTNGSFDINSTVGIYIDEVPYGSSSPFTGAARHTLDVGLFDIERIEVLRGPQGTLYGASTMGGLLKYVTRQPDPTRSGVDVRMGTSGTRNGNVSYNGAVTVNAPIAAGKAALRATGFYSRDGGYIDNAGLGQEDINSSDIHGGRADLLIAPSEAFSVRLSAFAQDISRDGDGTTDYTFAGAPVVGGLDQVRVFPEPFESRFRLISGTVTYDLGPAVLTSISSYQTTRTKYDWDFSSIFVPLLQTFFGRTYSAVGNRQGPSTDKFTQEVRLAADGNERFKWAIGGFYTDETTDYVIDLVLRDAAGQPAPNDLLSVFLPSDYEEYAAFGDLTWHLNSKFNVTGGIRYARNRQSNTQIGSGFLIGSRPTGHSSEDVFTYLANARYHFNDHATLYMRYATGYRPGGPNFAVDDPATGDPIGQPAFEADELKSYEAGFKAETEDRRFGIEASGYYIDWSNMQINVVRGGIASTANAAGGASVRGVELALAARLANALTLKGTFAYQDAELSEGDADLGGAKGERLPGVPRFTAGLNADYAFASRLQPTVGATLRYVSDRWASFNGSVGTPQYHLPEYETVDLRAGLTLGEVDMQLYLRNLLDERGQLSAVTSLGTTGRVALIQPRTFGVTASMGFW